MPCSTYPVLPAVPERGDQVDWLVALSDSVGSAVLVGAEPPPPAAETVQVALWLADPPGFVTVIMNVCAATDTPERFTGLVQGV